MKITRYIASNQFSCNVYLCQLDETKFIIDLGYFDNELKKRIENFGKIDFILLTHGHFDHIDGVQKFLSEYPNTPIYGIENTRTVTENSKINGYKLFLNQDINCSFEIISLNIGKNIIKNVCFETIYNPGHSIDSISFYFEKENVLFVGDFIFKATIGRSDLPTGNAFLMQNSLNKFKKRKWKDGMIIYPGHDKSFYIEEVLRINPYLK